MDDGNQRPRHPNTSRDVRNDSRPRPDANAREGRGSGGLLSRFGGGQAQDGGSAGGTRQSPPPQPSSPPPPPSGGAGWHKYDPEAGRWNEAPASANEASPGGNASSQRAPYATPLKNRLSQRPPDDEDDGFSDNMRGAWRAFTGQARRLGSGMKRLTDGITDGIRTPRAGEWRATDFDQNTLEDWDHNDSAPFELPPDPDDESREYRASSRPVRRDERSAAGRDGARRDSRPAAGTPYRGGQGGGGRDTRGGPRNWNDDNWEDAGWETGTWDTGWATDYQPSVGHGDEGSDSGFWSPTHNTGFGYDDDDAISQSLSTLARLSAVGEPIGRAERVRLLMRRRPAAAAMFAFFLLGFMLTCCAPIVPLLRLGYDTADAARRVQNLQDLLAGGSASLFNATKLKQAQVEVDGITHDLYEINGAMNLAGAPLAAVSPTMRNYRLLSQIGFDLTASADEGLQVAQTLLTPLQGGALSADTGTPGLTMQDIAQAHAVLGDASTRLQDAIVAFQALDPSALPSQLQPGSKYYKYLQMLPTGQAALTQLNLLLDSAPALLGIGEPANYLIVAMDRSELRPIGGFMGNYGFLTLEGGKQSKTQQLALKDTYELDKQYFDKYVPDKKSDPTKCVTQGPQPPEYFWWFPYGRGDPACTMAWGLRDSGLSPDFPTNARNAIQIVEDTPNGVPNTGKLQGMIAFTPVLIEMLLDPKVLGPITLPQFDNVTVTAANLEHEIHNYQLGPKQKSDIGRKTFTHELATALLAKVKTLHGASALKPVLAVAEKAIKDKELEIYFNDPHAELILRQLGLASSINTGNGDGFFVVDTNDSGNKASPLVHEKQTDYVTLLPNGGALHHLQISVTYDKQHFNIFNPVSSGYPFDDYSDVQRTYLPADATILGYAGFDPPAFSGDASGASCTPSWSSAAIMDCGEDKTHILSEPVTMSDVPGRSMIMGALYIRCGTGTNFYITNLAQEHNDCTYNAQSHTQTIYLEWYTPHAFTRDANGHGTYTMTVEKQPGSVDSLTVYIDNQVTAKNPNTSNILISDEDTWKQFVGSKKPLISNQLIESNTAVTFNF